MSTLYAAAARRRRERYAARPDLRRRLRRPVISVGNLAVGGRGKTPLVSSIARMLRDAGERPAVLSRGYGRARPDDGVVVVRDGDGIRADVARAGDEPMMLARRLHGIAVLSCPDRYLAGRFAEHHLDATVHILDDGFQHLQLERDLDLVILGREDVTRPQTLPSGRLREPLDAIVAADAVLAADADVDVTATGTDLPLFRLRHCVKTPPSDAGQPFVAVAGIAAPERFFESLRRAGCMLADTIAFPDHHRFREKDVRRIIGRAAQLGATIVTTEKDLVRLLPYRPFSVPIVHVPLEVEPDPMEAFREWLLGELAAIRGHARG